MPDSRISVLMLGDIIGKPGLRAVVSALSRLMKEYRADCVIINGENSFDGFGITQEITSQLFHIGADVITTGNHVWQQKLTKALLEREPRLLRPQNYAEGASFGTGMITIMVRQHPLTIMNLQGRQFMTAIDCPFRTARDLIKQSPGKMKVIDFHAESSAEKEALAHYLSGKVSAVMGTHTHVQTADLRILKEHTAYCTDIGICGSLQGIIGFDPVSSKRLVLTQVHQTFMVDDHPATLQGVHLCLDSETGRCLEASPLSYQSKV